MPLSRKNLFLILYFLGIFFSSRSQDLKILLPSLTVCPGSLAIPVNVEEFNGVASISLKFTYDTLSLSYQSFSDPHPSLSSGMLLVNAAGGKMIMSWFSLNPANIGTATLMDLHFDYNGNTDSELNWDDSLPGNCMITDINGEEIPSFLIDGEVVNLMKPPVLLTPADEDTNASLTPVLHWNGTSCGPLYSLELATDSIFQELVQSMNGIFGTSYTTPALSYNTVYYWRVRASNSIHTTPWSPVFSFKTGSGIGYAEIPDRHDLKIQPNPFRHTTLISFYLSGDMDAMIKIVNPNSELVYEKEYHAFSAGLQLMQADLRHLQPGMYFIHILIRGANQHRMMQGGLLIKTN